MALTIIFIRPGQWPVNKQTLQNICKL